MCFANRGRCWRRCSRADNRDMDSRLWLWPNLLSLDAPVVALLWQVLFIRCFHARLGATPSLLLVLAVWIVYAADRMLDAWRGEEHQPRHEFYRRHWRAVLPIWTGVLAGGAWLAWTRLSSDLFVHGMLVAAGTGVYLAAVHLAPRLCNLAGGKESAVAVLFALGASLAVWSGVETAGDVLSILVFSCLCWMNCAAIEDWEHGRSARPAIVIAAAVVALIAGIFLREHRPILGGAEAASALGLMAVDRLRGRSSADVLRVLADVALLTPIVFLPV